jgi:hypothetical protein
VGQVESIAAMRAMRQHTDLLVCIRARYHSTHKSGIIQQLIRRRVVF